MEQPVLDFFNRPVCNPGSGSLSAHLFHCSRHTAATLLLTLGADLYTVSKILGHRSIRMTEVYAKIVDKKKIETMNLVNNMFV